LHPDTLGPACPIFAFGAHHPSMKPLSIILISAVAVSATLCIAGTAWHYKCESPKCGFDGDLEVGGGFDYNQASGYCTTCKKFVSVSWKRERVTEELKKVQDKSTNLPATAPAKLGTTWNPATGYTAALYPCPHCRKPFMEIDNISLVRGSVESGKVLCPKCTNLTLSFKHRGNYD